MAIENIINIGRVALLSRDSGVDHDVVNLPYEPPHEPHAIARNGPHNLSVWKFKKTYNHEFIPYAFALVFGIRMGIRIRSWWTLALANDQSLMLR